MHVVYVLLFTSLSHQMIYQKWKIVAHEILILPLIRRGLMSVRINVSPRVGLLIKHW